ncbi:MAG: hypothetical protein L6Q78_10900 [Bacteroidia bacterium]|nr:hypothetical protein [Bacteroidia bacterium]
MARNNEEKSQVHLIIDGKAANASLRDLEAAARKVRSELRGMATDSKEFKGASANLERINKELEQTRVKAGLAKSSFSKMASEIKTTFIGNLGANLATFGLGKVADFFVNAWQNAKQLAELLPGSLVLPRIRLPGLLNL